MIISLFPSLFIVFLVTINFACKFLLSKVLRSQQKRRKMKEELEVVYSFYLRLLIELSLEIGICSMVEISMKQVKTVPEKISYFFSLSSLVGIILFIKHCDKMITKNFYKINNIKYPAFNLYWGELWADLKLTRTFPKFNLIFMYRRLAYSAIIVIPALFDNVLPLFQMILVIKLNL